MSAYMKPTYTATPSLIDDELGLAGLITTDRWLAIVGGILGGVATCLALLIRYAHHCNTASKGHRP